jgi:hypothetical protein
MLSGRVYLHEASALQKSSGKLILNFETQTSENCEPFTFYTIDESW